MNIESPINDELVHMVCDICDNGGLIQRCDGICKRAFHVTPGIAAGLPEPECLALGTYDAGLRGEDNSTCKNCMHRLHQCFYCRQLGSSDVSTEVFQCADETCGYFYHPYFVAHLLCWDNTIAAKELRDQILKGGPFTCPLHVCFACGQPQNTAIHERQMAMCRRCPKAYHQNCLPREIAFEDNDDEGTVQRAFRDLLENRILMYCLDHEIPIESSTPEINHIRFPDDPN